MIRRPPRSTLDRSSAASDVYKRQVAVLVDLEPLADLVEHLGLEAAGLARPLLEEVEAALRRELEEVVLARAQHRCRAGQRRGRVLQRRRGVDRAAVLAAVAV